MGEKKITKTQKIVEHLQNNGCITSLEAIELYKATRLSSIIFNLRKKGMNIETIDIPFTDIDGNKSYYGKYVLNES